MVAREPVVGRPDGEVAELHRVADVDDLRGAAAAALLVFVNVAPNTWQIRLRPRVWQGIAVGVAAAIAVMTISQPHPFLYFQF